MDRITHKEVFSRYYNDVNYKANLGLYEKIRQQENFFIGRQWEGLNAPDLEKPVINVTKRVTNYLISVLLVNDVAVNFRQPLPLVGNRDAVVMDDHSKWQDIAAREMEKVQENIKFRQKMRHILRNAAVDGDAAVYIRFEPEEEGANPDTVSGGIQAEIVDSLCVHFGDKQTADVQKQPWIIISKTQLTSQLKERYPHLAHSIRSDEEVFESQLKSHIDQKMTTVCIYLWKDSRTKRVWCMECTHDCVLQQAADTGLKRYPVCWMNWERVKDSYHGIGVVEEIIPNQIAINKLWAMSLIYAKDMAFPKIIYDKSKLDRWTNKVGAAVGVMGNVNDAIATTFRPSELPVQVLNLVNQTVAYTKEFMGANDVVLGNVNPENTSAIIALQKSSAAPLELQRLGFYQFIEDMVRTVYEIMRVKFGQRYVMCEEETNGVKQKVARLVDFQQLPADEDVIVDIGASDYWSEITQTNTMDNLFRNGILQDAVAYVESVPDKNIKNKQAVIQTIKKQQDRQHFLEEIKAYGLAENDL